MPRDDSRNIPLEKVGDMKDEALCVTSFSFAIDEFSYHRQVSALLPVIRFRGLHVCSSQQLQDTDAKKNFFINVFARCANSPPSKYVYISFQSKEGSPLVVTAVKFTLKGIECQLYGGWVSRLA